MEFMVLTLTIHIYIYIYTYFVTPKKYLAYISDVQKKNALSQSPVLNPSRYVRIMFKVGSQDPSKAIFFSQ